MIVALFALWEWRLERRGGMPVVSMRLFANRHFVDAAEVISVMMIAQTGVIFSLPVFLQSVRQLDALHTGLALLPMSAMILIISPASAPLSRRIAHKRLVQTGLVLNAADMSPARLIPGLIVYGIGLGRDEHVPADRHRCGGKRRRSASAARFSAARWPRWWRR